jgi:Bacterial sugar transferase
VGHIVMALFEFLGKLCLGCLGKLCSDECKAWLPRITERVLRIAVAALPADLRERFGEEWRSDLNEIPGELGRLVWALGLVWAALKVSNDHSFARFLGWVVALLLFLLGAPLCLLTALLIKLTDPGPAIWTSTTTYRGRDIKIRGFRTFSYDPKNLGTYIFLHLHLRMTPITAGEQAQLNRIFRDNPPLTMIGRFVNYMEMDLLLGLLNVLYGDYSLSDLLRAP